MFYYKKDVLEELKKSGYSTYTLRKEKIMGERTIQQLREKQLVSWDCLDKICKLTGLDPWDIVGYEDYTNKKPDAP